MAENVNIKISTIIPTHNRRTLVQETIDSLMAQTIPLEEHEIIVVDDCSTDGTIEAIHTKYPEEIKSGRLRILSTEKQSGGFSAIPRNIGLRAARGQYVSFLDDDDLATPNRLETLAGFLDDHQKIDFVHADFTVIDEYGNAQPTEDTSVGQHFKRTRNGKQKDLNLEHLKIENFVHAQTVMMRRGIVEKIDYQDESLSNAEDYDYWLKLADAGFKMAFVPEQVTRYREHKQNKTIQSENKNQLSTQQVCARIARAKSDIRSRFRKDPKVLMLTWDDKGAAIGRVSSGLTRGLFTAGITNIRYIKSVNPVHTQNPQGLFHRKVDSRMVQNGQEEFYHNRGWDFRRTLDAILKGEPFDIAHIQSNQFHRDNPLLTRGVTIHTLHSLLAYQRDVEDNGFEGSLVTLQEKIMQDADRIQVMTRAYRDIVLQYYPHLEDKLVVIPNGRDFVSDSEPLRDPNNHTILTVARLDKCKNHEDVIRSIGLIKEVVPDIQLQIVGEGRLRKKLEQVIKENGVSKQVKLLGWKNPGELQKFYERANLFVLYSLDENDPNVVLEASDYRLPIISSDIPELKETLRNGHHCLKAPPRNPRELAKVILHALRNPKEMTMYARAAHSKLLAERGWENIANQMIEVYAKMMAKAT